MPEAADSHERAGRPAEEIWELLTTDRADMANTLGVRFLSEDPHVVRLSMDWSPELAQPAGLFSATALFGLADFASTMVAMRAIADGFPLAVGSDVHVLRNASSGRVIGEATLLRRGRRLLIARCTVTHPERGTLADVTTTFVVDSPEQGGGRP